MHDVLQDEAVYKKLITDLLVQGLIKLIEPTIILKVRKSDLALIKSCVKPAVAKYREMMVTQVQVFEDKKAADPDFELKCKVKIDEENFLHEWDANDQEKSCLGGFVMYAKKNRIVCSQTLDERMSLVYMQAIPQIRAMLFPSLVRNTK